MSTREIAELTGKQHNHVLRDADKMLEELEITASKFGSSLEIAGLCEKRHDNVLRDARKMLQALDIKPSPQIWGKVPSAGRAPLDVANLPKRECLILVSGYSVEMRARIIDRWLELEAVVGGAVTPDGVMTDLDERAAKRLGGIVKSMVHKEIRDLLPALAARHSKNA